MDAAGPAVLAVLLGKLHLEHAKTNRQLYTVWTFDIFPDLQAKQLKTYSEKQFFCQPRSAEMGTRQFSGKGVGIGKLNRVINACVYFLNLNTPQVLALAADLA